MGYPRPRQEGATGGAAEMITFDQILPITVEVLHLPRISQMAEPFRDDHL
jgi:hypothetical protein